MMELMIAVYAWNHKRIIVIQHLREFERQLLIAFIGSVVMLTGCVSVKSAGPPAQVVVESQPLLVDTRPCTNTFVPIACLTSPAVPVRPIDIIRLWFHTLRWVPGSH